MVLQQYLGPLRPPLLRISIILSNQLTKLGLTPPPEHLLIDSLLITFIVLLLTLPLIKKIKRNSRNAILLLGISGENDLPAVGKTAIFNALRYGNLPKHGTLPSMVVNDAIFAAVGTNAPRRWVDFPGHPRLRHTLPPYLSYAKCIVFVIDSSSFTAHARKDTELLYYILTHPVVAKNATPILMFCNKSDLPNLANIAAVQTRLEAELERAKNADTATLSSAHVGTPTEEEEQRAFLGYENEPFAFDHASAPVSFASGSAVKGDVQAIINFVKTSFL